MDNNVFTDKNILSELLKSFIDVFSIGIYLFDSKGESLFANDYFLKIIGYSMEELRTVPISRLFHEDDLSILKKGTEEDSSEEQQLIRVRKKNDSTIPLEIHCKKDVQDAYLFAFSAITEKNSSPQMLFNELDNIIGAFDQSVAFFIADVEGKIALASDKFFELSGYTNEELLEKEQPFISEDLFKKITDTIKNGEIWDGEVNYKGKSGTTWWGETMSVPLLTGEEGMSRQFIAICTDITNKKKLKDQFFEIEHYDFLTKLPNRRYFEQILKKEIASGKDFSLLLLDMHGVKFVNDSLGIKIGDKLIKETAYRLNQFLGKRGTLFRVDGDEFSIILPGSLENESLKKLAEDIISIFEEPYTLGEYELFHAINIGISKFPEHGNNVHMITRNTYASLNQAKIKGKNHYSIFSSCMNMQLKKRFQLSVDLPKALKKNQLYVDFQPRVNAKTNEIISAEALVRWRHPTLGIVSPNDFIPLAEENGSISLIGKRVLLEACRQNKKWQDAGLPPIIVSVNLSVIEFLQLDIVKTIRGILRETRLDPQWLEIELTETALIKDESTVSYKLKKLREMGIKTAIDDFGTGYASLSYLKNLKANTLKIDRSFISGIHQESGSLEIVTAIINLAKKLNIRTTAEGVETLEQLNLLQKVKCDEIQGYLYSRPVTAMAFEKILHKKFCYPE